ncbi:MAG: alpha-amylase family glycosyl hydrolase [Hellea sp.]
MRQAIALSVLAGALMACGPSTQTPPSGPNVEVAVSKIQAPDWSKDAVIYQINTRQYSVAGNFKAVEQDLARIKSLGVDILWFMPIHPIGEAKRKGSMGSPYAVKDFQAVNPDLGTLDDFKSLVDAAHAMDMKVIIDWVANHTAWDNVLMESHPNWYTRDDKDEMQHPPETDWTDVADLDYSKQGLRDYMTESLLYWVRDVGIDGYRCDVAGMVPTDFWNSVRPKLDAIKPVFMLAEWQEPELHEKAFDASYAWRWKEIMQDIVKGKADARDIAGYYTDYQQNWPKGAMRMAYTENHDQNTWDGTTGDIYGDALEVAMALSFVGDGIPLIYNGQEANHQTRLAFFEKDLINWQDHPQKDFITKLTSLKENNSVLWNGAWGAPMEILPNSNPEQVLSFTRKDTKSSITAIFNVSNKTANVGISAEAVEGEFKAFNSGELVTLNAGTKLTLQPWEFRIYIR